MRFLYWRNKSEELGKGSLWLAVFCCLWFFSLLLPPAAAFFFPFFSKIRVGVGGWKEASEQSHLQSEAYIGSLYGKMRQTMTRYTTVDLRLNK